VYALVYAFLHATLADVLSLKYHRFALVSIFGVILSHSLPGIYLLQLHQSAIEYGHMVM